MSFLKERKRKWIVSYDLEIDGKKEEDLEHALAAPNVVEAVTKAMDEIYTIARLQASDVSTAKCDIWDVCEVEE